MLQLLVYLFVTSKPIINSHILACHREASQLQMYFLLSGFRQGLFIMAQLSHILVFLAMVRSALLACSPH